MSSDDSHLRSHMTPTACNICTRAIFTTSSFNFGLPIYFVSHCCYVFSKKVEQSCLTVVWKMTCQRSYILVCCLCWCGSCRHRVFVLLDSVCFGSFKKICLALLETGVTFFQEHHSTHQFARLFFFLRSMFVLSLSLLTLFIIWLTFSLPPHDSNLFKYRLSRIKSCGYFACCICRYGLDQAYYFIS